MLLIYCIIRICGQICGMIYMLMASKPFGLLLAYIIMTAEGYFIIVWESLSFVIDWHKCNFGGSFMNYPLYWKSLNPTKHRILALLRTSKHLFHLLFITANTLLVISGTIVIKPNPSGEYIGMILRTAGSAIFLAGIIVIIGILIYTFYLCRTKYHYPWKQLGTLFIISLAMPFLLVRGVFGVLQACDYEYTYSNEENYTADGFSTSFLIGEYVLSIAMELITCMLLLSTRLTVSYEPFKQNDTSEMLKSS